MTNFIKNYNMNHISVWTACTETEIQVPSWFLGSILPWQLYWVCGWLWSPFSWIFGHQVAFSKACSRWVLFHTL